MSSKRIRKVQTKTHEGEMNKIHKILHLISGITLFISGCLLYYQHGIKPSLGCVAMPINVWLVSLDILFIVTGIYGMLNGIFMNRELQKHTREK